MLQFPPKSGLMKNTLKLLAVLLALVMISVIGFTAGINSSSGDKKVQSDSTYNVESPSTSLTSAPRPLPDTEEQP